LKVSDLPIFDEAKRNGICSEGSASIIPSLKLLAIKTLCKETKDGKRFESIFLMLTEFNIKGHYFFSFFS
jgi:hypothetical protein